MKRSTLSPACAALMVCLFSCLLAGCSEHVPSRTAPAVDSPASPPSASPILQASGLVLHCVKCAFTEEQGSRYITGQIHNDAKLPVNGYVMVVELLDSRGQSVKRISGLILMSALPLEAGAMKDFSERILADETNITQAVVYLQKAGSAERLSDSLTLRLKNVPRAAVSQSPPGKTANSVKP